MADIALDSAPVTWQVANQTRGGTGAGANGLVEFIASAVAIFQGGLTVLPSPQTAEVVDGVMAAIDLPVNDPQVWNWQVRPRLGVDWPPFHINVPKDGADLSSAAVVPGTGPVRVLQGPQGASVVGAEDLHDGTVRFILDDGTRTPPVPITQGPEGPANSLTVGTVVNGDQAAATIIGKAPSQTLNLVLPHGLPGARGDAGRGMTGITASESGGDFTVTYTDGTSSGFTIDWSTVALPGNYSPKEGTEVTPKSYVDGLVKEAHVAGAGLSPEQVRGAVGFDILVGGGQPPAQPAPVLWVDTRGPRVQPPGFPPRDWPLASDQFARPDGVLGDTMWGGKTWYSARTEWGLRGGRAKVVSAPGNAYAILNVGTTEHEALAQIATKPVDGSVTGVVARYVDESTHLVVQTRSTVSGTEYALWERPGRSGNAITEIARTGITPKAGDVFGLRVSGKSVDVIVNGVPVASTTTLITSGDRVGLYGHSNDLTSAYSAFTAKGV